MDPRLETHAAMLRGLDELQQPGEISEKVLHILTLTRSLPYREILSLRVYIQDHAIEGVFRTEDYFEKGNPNLAALVKALSDSELRALHHELRKITKPTHDDIVRRIRHGIWRVLRKA